MTAHANHTTPTPSTVERWIATFPENDGIRYLTSNRSFGGSEVGEEAYAQQFAVDEDYVARVSAGISHVLSAAAADRSAGALEIGCGTGIFTRALVAGTDYPSYYITDMSAVFVEGTRRAVRARFPDKPVVYMVLSSEGFDAWPESSLSLVALRYVLHHVLDWRAFIKHASRLLVPGGVLLMEEPCADGYLLQVMMMKSLLARLDSLECTDESRAEIEFFISTILWYLRNGVDKSQSEDKHVFQPSELFAVGQELGLRTRLYQNLGLDAVSEEAGPAATYFADEFRHNLKVNFGFGQQTLELFETYVAPLCSDLSAISGSHNGPIIKGVFSFTRPR